MPTLEEASFGDTTLDGVDMSGVNLRKAMLHGTRFDQMTLARADLILGGRVPIVAERLW